MLVGNIEHLPPFRAQEDLHWTAQITNRPWRVLDANCLAVRKEPDGRMHEIERFVSQQQAMRFADKLNRRAARACKSPAVPET